MQSNIVAAIPNAKLKNCWAVSLSLNAKIPKSAMREEWAMLATGKNTTEGIRPAPMF